MNKFKYSQRIIVLALFLLIVVLFALTQSTFLDKHIKLERAKMPEQRVQLPSPTRTVIIDPASAWGL